ncbi:alpha-glucosidase [Sphaerochaeta sp. PS]|uniref:alpha-glucosidase n=1 Tax=Sphaerochaeta sp. PS TaxID=3076336 RepID=UPI0028A42276|nr:alpha-glucosidase [Sphaerochaeta sp. PS]MDT4761242.1 alpha-glucosidase [Sphaerochaeta sp. PS]
MISCTMQKERLVLLYDKLPIIEHTPSSPCIYLYRGTEKIDMYRGNYFIEDDLQDKVGLKGYELSQSLKEGRVHYTIRFYQDDISMTCSLLERDGRLEMLFSAIPSPYNRLELFITAEKDEHVYGCGEQFSYLDLRGRNFPLWTGEQGVGRNKKTAITQTADREDRAGGDYHTTFYPQPTFVSSRGYFFHAETYGYADFDFSSQRAHRLMFWDVPSSITLSAKPTLLEVVQDISAFLGRQGKLPLWVYDGVILGMQGGTQNCLDKLERMQRSSVPVVGIWAQDWQGERYTSFGKRLRWNWQWDPVLYPDLDKVVAKLADEGVRFLGYINPYVLEGHELYNEADAKGFLALNGEGKPYLVDFGEFYAGIVDFTNPQAKAWYVKVIQKEMIDFGLGGWMADFGEYLPTDVVLFDKSPAMIAHNQWPGIWAEVNKLAVEGAGKADEILYFMRAGNARSLALCPMMWAGDQNVDWSEDDGLPSVITSALSLAMSGMGLHHSDIGGYTTLYGMKRTKELLCRWTEFAAFTPLMRTHEGNRPKDNWQFDGDGQTIALFARMATIHARLKAYLIVAVGENAEHGTPVMRPIFLHYPEKPFFTCKDEYLLGRDLLVAPILEEGASQRSVLLPDDEWVHLFTSRVYGPGEHRIDAPMGSPAVFYRKRSPFASLFSSFALS